MRSSKLPNCRCRSIRLKCVVIALFLSFCEAVMPVNAGDGPIIRRCPIKVIHRATLASEQSGIVGTAVPKEGDVVSADDVIVKLRDNIARAANESARLQAENEIPIRSAENARELAELEFDRSLQANRRTRGTVSEMEVKRLELAAKQAEFERQQAVADQQLAISRASEAQAQLDSYAITAPFDGEVVRVFKSRGEAVRQGDPILEVVNIDQVRVELDLPIQYRSLIRKGLKVDVVPLSQTDDPKANTWSGIVSYVSPTAEPITQTLLVFVTVENEQHLLVPGTAADVVLTSKPTVFEAETAVAPETAVQ